MMLHGCSSSEAGLLSKISHMYAHEHTYMFTYVRAQTRTHKYTHVSLFEDRDARRQGASTEDLLALLAGRSQPIRTCR